LPAIVPQVRDLVVTFQKLVVDYPGLQLNEKVVCPACLTREAVEKNHFDLWECIQETQLFCNECGDFVSVGLCAAFQQRIRSQRASIVSADMLSQTLTPAIVAAKATAENGLDVKVDSLLGLRMRDRRGSALTFAAFISHHKASCASQCTLFLLDHETTPLSRNVAPLAHW